MAICPYCYNHIDEPQYYESSVLCQYCNFRLDYSRLFEIPDVFILRLWYNLHRCVRITLGILFWIGLFIILPLIGIFYRLFWAYITSIWLITPCALIIIHYSGGLINSSIHRINFVCPIIIAIQTINSFGLICTAFTSGQFEKFPESLLGWPILIVAILIPVATKKICKSIKCASENKRQLVGRI